MLVWLLRIAQLLASASDFAPVAELESSQAPCGDSQGFYAHSFCCRDKYHEFCYTRIHGVDWPRCCQEHSEKYFGLAEIPPPGVPVPQSNRIDCCEFPILGGYWLQYPLFTEMPDDGQSQEISWLAWLIYRFQEDVEPALGSVRLDLRSAVNHIKTGWARWRASQLDGLTNPGDAPELARIASSLEETWTIAFNDVKFSQFGSSSKPWCRGVLLGEASAASPVEYFQTEFAYLGTQISQLVSKLRHTQVSNTPGGITALEVLWADFEAAGAAVGDVLHRGAVYVNSHAFLMAAATWGPAPAAQIFAPRGSNSGYKTNVLKHLLLNAGFANGNTSGTSRRYRDIVRTASFWRSLEKLPGALRFGSGGSGQIANLSRAKGIFVEFGVQQGHTAEYMLANFPDLLYLGVDPYYQAERGLRDSSWVAADSNLARFGRRALLLRMGTVQAGMIIRNAGLPQGAIAAAYEDGVKSYSSTLAGLQLWFPLLQVGGFFAHDDYFNADGAIAMWHYAQQRKYLIQLAGHKTMVCRKPT